VTRKGVLGAVSIDAHPYRCIERTLDEVLPLADQIRTGLTNSDRSDKYETASRFVSWHLGMGLGEIRDATDQGRIHYSSNVDPRFRGQLILGPQLSAAMTFTDGATAESKVQFIEYNGGEYAIGLRYVHKYNEGTDKWDTSKDMGATAAAIKGAAVVYGDYLVVGAGSAVNYWRLFTNGTWDQPYATNNPSLFALVGNTLWMVYNSNQEASSVNMTTWTTAVAIGESRHAATLITDYNGNPLVGKGEGLFEYDGTKVSNRLPELASVLNAANCRGGKPSRGKLYLPVGPALWQYTSDAVQTEGKPTRSAEYLAAGISRESSSEVRGSIVDLWPDIDFLWGILAAQSGNYYITAYDYNPTAGQGWHQVAKTGTTAVTALGRFQPATGNPRLFYSEGTAIKYFLLPKNALNPYVDAGYRYALTGDIYLPVEADTFDDVVKAYLSVKINADNITATRYVDVAYSVDGGVEATLGRVTTSGISTLFFPSSTIGRRISLHLHFVTNDPTITPRVLPFSRHFQYRFDRKRIWKLTLALGRSALPNIPKQAFSQLSDLGSARDSQAPVAFVDLDHTQWTAFVDKVGETQIIDDGAEHVVTAVVEMREWRSGLGVNRWNDAVTVFDDTSRWSNGTDNNVAVWA
jgi:hypothetical protein